ncbi:MAG: Lrp/AsnC ligand binding domain-containing protein [archaeon GB-1867-035]|nr:Lrp/AsnC ligand binding domain-containing protein [Candidatus Culexmicrobium profundum]
MVEAIILVNTRVGTEEEVIKKLLKIDKVREVYFVYGVYDIIVKVQADDINKLREVVTTKIRRIDNILSTSTMVVMEAYKKSII